MGILLFVVVYLLLGACGFAYALFTTAAEHTKKNTKVTADEMTICFWLYGVFWPIGLGFTIGILIWAWATVQNNRKDN